MRFPLEPELELFAASVRGAVGVWEAPLEPVFGEWQDDRDDALAARLAEIGWGELWSDPDLLGPAVAGGVELGRAVAPLCLVDEATLGAPLAVDGRVRHGEGRVEGGEREPTLDGTGTLRGVESVVPSDPARLQAWGAVTLAYLAGLADGAVEKAVAHALAREQFGAPIARLAAVQARLADAALVRDGLVLSAWSAADPDGAFPRDSLAWAGGACREVTMHVQQVHGGIGFALEGGVHRYFRRAKSVQVWTDVLLSELASP
ncbi:MAG: acyl-CoA dehydrogenase [Thermoleophilia bacterium]|nr:acyl-CoA dehydrogenase [Thermoleophilia bacterium]